MNSLDMMKQNEPYVISDFDMPKNLQRHARELCFEYNHLSPKDNDKKRDILKSLFGTCSDLTFIESTFNCDYGFNIHTKGLCVINFNTTILDTSPIYIGSNVFIAPGVVIACSGHSLDPIERSKGIMTSAPITIGDNVWIGANATICAGVTIGANSVIGAGSVVVRDIEENSVAVGSPAKVIRKINDNDKLMLKKQLDKLS